MKKVLMLFVLCFTWNNLFAQSDSSALARITEIRSRLISGEDFCELAKVYSEDKASKMNCGDIGFFAKGQLMRGYEDAMVSLKVMQLSEIVKTGHGYHIIQLLEKSGGRYRTRHILIKTN